MVKRKGRLWAYETKSGGPNNGLLTLLGQNCSAPSKGPMKLLSSLIVIEKNDGREKRVK